MAGRVFETPDLLALTDYV